MSSSSRPDIIFAGTPEPARIVLEHLIKADFRPSLVVTPTIKSAGRRSPETAVADFAKAQGIHLAQPKRIEEIMAGRSTPDLMIVTIFSQILKPAILRWPTSGCLNVHPSLLPKYRGPSPVASAILEGESITGSTIMKLAEGVDSGPILSQQQLAIDPADTTESLSIKLAELGGQLLVKAIPGYLRDTVKPEAQAASQGTMTRRFSKADGRIDWTKPADYLERFVRAMNPWPGASTELDGQSLTIIQAAVSNEELPPGEFAGDTPLRVGTGQGSLEIKRLKIAGKKETSSDDWLRGYRGQARRFS